MKFVLWGTYCADASERRAPYRDEHLAGLRSLKERGLLITLGPTADTSHVFGIFEADSQQQVEDLVHADIYWRQGIWTALVVHPWIQAF